MNKNSLMTFLKSYISLAAIMLLIYLILGPSKNVSLIFVITLGLPITAIMVFTGWDKKLKKHLP
ncbi:hypothetical protein BFP46_24730 [Bacillus licheniformis]|nr:hypothetical protein BFP47_23395 [Bacillus licheniformis]OJT66470.1 hypothetical protein BFP46_24730 [Bacillus licheniformis]